MDAATTPAALILPGPSGAGKGTQAWIPEDKSGLARFRTGDLLRVDDNAETVASRLTAYQAQTLPLIEDCRGECVLKRALPWQRSVQSPAIRRRSLSA